MYRSVAVSYNTYTEAALPQRQVTPNFVIDFAANDPKHTWIEINSLPITAFRTCWECSLDWGCTVWRALLIGRIEIFGSLKMPYKITSSALETQKTQTPHCYCRCSVLSSSFFLVRLVPLFHRNLRSLASHLWKRAWSNWNFDTICIIKWSQ